MALIRSFASSFVCISGTNVYALIERNEKVVEQRFTVKERTEKEEESGSENEEEKNATAVKNRILASCCSESGKLLALCDELKQLHLYTLEDQWEIKSCRTVPRKCTALTFTEDGRHVLVADKTGNVYRFSVEDSSHKGELLLGHLSILLDITVAKKDKYVITCDRDEKIRVSCFPNSYNVHSYCLQHTEYVASVVFIKDYDILVSGGGDGKVILWNLDGEALCEVDCKVAGSKFKDNSTKENGTDQSEDSNFSIKKCAYSDNLHTLCVSFYNSSLIHLYQIKQADDIPSCDLCDILRVNREPWDISCSPVQKLYILQPVEGETVLVYDLLEQNNSIKGVKSTDDSCIMNEVQKMNHDWDFFKESTDIPSLYPGLIKIRDDKNVKEYMEKKQIRLSGQKLSNPPPQKKSKLS